MAKYFWQQLDNNQDLEFDDTTNEMEVVVPDIHWKDAYEANKTRKTCILCGKNTIEKAIFSSIINICPCVDTLAKEKEQND